MRRQHSPFFTRCILALLPVLAITLLLGAFELRDLSRQNRSLMTPPPKIGAIGQAFEQAALEFHVPATLLKAICYMEGRLSNNAGSPSIDNGFGCMHLVKNRQTDTLDRAASELRVSTSQLQQNLPTNIRGGAALLRDYALQLSSTHQLPQNLNDWYGTVAAYSNATTRSTALMYADAVYTLVNQGFSAQADDAETITLPPQGVQPNRTTALAVKGAKSLPTGCKLDHKADYPEAIDCILPAHIFDCNKTPKNAPCNYESAKRPTDYAVDAIVIHDIEGTIQGALDVFQNPQTQASAHYIVDSNGTVYQVIRDKDIAYHAGNYWYNQHSIGIEHAGFDATGFRWYNAAEYLASAKLTAYLLQKYNLPLDRAHVVAHSTVPSPSATSLPNHVDPGPYWLWDYYFTLIHQQGVAFPDAATTPHIFLLHPKSDHRPFGKQGRENPANFSFFYLYNGPSTTSGRIPQQGSRSDITDVTGCIEPDVSYYYLAKVTDPAGSGGMMYKIWYGVEDQAQSTGSRFAHAHLVWLAVPRGATRSGEGTLVTLHADHGKLQIYGQPTTGGHKVIGDAPAGAAFVSTYTVTEDGKSALWYEIDYNHRQGWVPDSEVTLPLSASGQ